MRVGDNGPLKAPSWQLLAAASIRVSLGHRARGCEGAGKGVWKWGKRQGCKGWGWDNDEEKQGLTRRGQKKGDGAWIRMEKEKH